MERLTAIENEMAEEEQAALELLKTEKDVLVTTFESVKTEFSDLDGMVWDRPQMSASSSSSTILPNGDENIPPLQQSESVPASISLPVLFASTTTTRRVNDDSTIRASAHGRPRSRLTSLPSKVDPMTMNIDEKIRDDLRAAYEKAAKKRSRSPVKALFTPPAFHGDVKTKPALSPRGRMSTPFPSFHVVMEAERCDSPKPGSPLWLSSVEGEDDGTIRPNVSGDRLAKKGVRMIFGLGVTSPLADPGRR